MQLCGVDRLARRIFGVVEEHFFGESERIAAFDVDRLLAMGEPDDSEGEEGDEPAPLS